MVNLAFKEPVHRILEKIKHKSFLSWPGKMSEDPTRRNQNLYCIYCSEKRHSTEQCRTFKDHLEQLANARHLREFVMDQGARSSGQGSSSEGRAMPPTLNIIEVIHATLNTSIITPGHKGVMTITIPQDAEPKDWPYKRQRISDKRITFRVKELVRTTQSHDNALVVTLQVR